MSVEQAFKYFQFLKSNPAPRVELARQISQLRLEDLVEAGKTEGFIFTVSDLRKAFFHEWTMRRLPSTRKVL